MSHDPLESYKVHVIKALKRQKRNDEAQQTLQRIAAQVQPILRKRKWSVPKLNEFFPSNPNLLGLNIGGGRGRTLEIRIRLRPHNDASSFYPYEHTLGTMLHEITHNVRAPHDAEFYKILDELTDECESLMAKGISGTGVGFDGPSMGRLGSHGRIAIHNPSEQQLRAAAVKAAAQRAAQQAIMHAGPRTLGGDITRMKNLNPREASANAAGRRQRDNRWCPSGSGVPLSDDTLADGADDDLIIVGITTDRTPSTLLNSTEHSSASTFQSLHKGHRNRGGLHPTLGIGGVMTKNKGLSRTGTVRSKNNDTNTSGTAFQVDRVEREPHKRCQDGALGILDHPVEQKNSSGTVKISCMDLTSPEVHRDRDTHAEVRTSRRDGEECDRDHTRGAIVGNGAIVVDDECDPMSELTGLRHGVKRRKTFEGHSSGVFMRSKVVMPDSIGHATEERCDDAGTQECAALGPIRAARAEWVCNACTLKNRAMALQCEACLAVKAG